MADPAPQPKNKFWIVMIAALAILVVAWIVYTASGPDPADVDMSKTSDTELGQSMAAEEQVPVTLPDSEVEDVAVPVEPTGVAGE
ncbi:hypothetical protein GCM10011371_20040 [Novosphingobium marinum]|uniref:Uncharacterized protein n=1 Tax=Novosphingobium marinum TaxID=1514948 RepID=A0A7Y9XWX1_9SPHN|nr:hypothetical protein [Novosphingobium marinum]NYH96116.1 hypothetical protein [Novosphingobium marinum]GGC32622.1 hypothetical protein GCM10011371_20040 [Novosphingobium marinum]